jgi:mitogen-activated protein kinase kinase kinase 7
MADAAEATYDDDFDEEEEASAAAAPPAPPAPAPASSLNAALTRVIPAGELQLGRQLGSGSYATIFEAQWARPAPLPPLPCAAKVLVDPAAAAEYTAELRALASFGAHPNLLALLGASHLPRPCFITELLRGGTLAQALRAPPRGAGAWPLACVLRWGADVARGVAHLHALTPAPLLHRDIKAANVLLRLPADAAGGGGAGAAEAVLCDFGLAGCARSVAGTPTHMAPELLREGGGAPPTRGADVYALGTLLWSLLAGQEAWAGWRVPDLQQAVLRGERPSLALVRADCPGALRELVGACWAEDPGARPSAGALEGALSRAAGEAAAAAQASGGGSSAAGGSGGSSARSAGAGASGDSLDALFSSTTVKRGGKK